MANFDDIEETTKAETGGIQPVIPSKTKLVCNIAGVQIVPEDDYGNQELLQVAWMVTDVGAYQDFVVNQKIHINDLKATKQKKALTMLAAIDANCGGNIRKVLSKGKEIEDLDEAFFRRALVGNELTIEFEVYTLNEGEPNERSGNYVGSIAPANVAERKRVEKQARNQPQAPVEDAVDFDDDLDPPF